MFIDESVSHILDFCYDTSTDKKPQAKKLYVHCAKCNASAVAPQQHSQ